jgi:general secretion pathway protein A
MYEQFYGIEKNAFALTPDPRFLVMTEAHCEVKAGLTYAILARKGFTVLTGDAGTGKTTLLRAVINSIPKEQISFSFLVNPVVTPDEFYDLVLGELGLPTGMTKPDRLRKFLEFLVECRAAGRVCVLFVDEAHRLSFEMLEEIRLLTNFETEIEKLLHIVLVGQDELDELLDRRELRQLKQRVEVRQHIGHLAPEEVPLYISHRWKCAGGSTAPFSTEAVRQVARVSGGIPRLINSICDNALLLGFAESAATITEKHIGEVSRDLRLNGAGLNGAGLNGAGSKGAGLNGTAHHGAIQAAASRQSAQVAPAASLDIKVPEPVPHAYSNHPLSLFGSRKPKRPWWRFTGAAKA